MQNFGSKNSTESEMLMPIWKMRPLVRIMSGQTCMSAWQKKQKKKASKN